MAKLRPTKTEELFYPSSDGKPMAESDLHRDITVQLIEVLRDRYRDRPDVYVSGNLLVYYERGNRFKCLAPDCFVVFGAMNFPQEVYQVWEEPRPPQIVFEVTSKTTEEEDCYRKFQIYDQIWKVDELYLFDPTEDYLKPPMQGFHRGDGQLRSVVPEEGFLRSPALGLGFALEHDELIIVDLANRQRILHSAEERHRLRAELDQAQAELARLRQQLAALQHNKPQD